MQIIEHNQERLILSFRHSIATYLLISIGFVLVGFFSGMISLLLVQSSEGSWVLFCGMGVVLIAGGIVWISRFPKINRFTFDRSGSCLIMEQKNFQNQSIEQFLEIPLHLIIGVEVSSSFSSADSPTSYYPNLVLDRVYWRIHLDSDGRYDTAVKIATTISQFLEINYFPDESKAPLPVWEQKVLEGAAPYQFHWKYLEEEVDRLQKHLSQYPLDAQAHQELGILMRFNRREAIAHLKQAESLFESQQKIESAVLTRVLQNLVIWRQW